MTPGEPINASNPALTLPQPSPVPVLGRHPIITVLLAIVAMGGTSLGGAALVRTPDATTAITEQGLATSGKLHDIQTSIGLMGGKLDRLTQDVAIITRDLKTVDSATTDNKLAIAKLEQGLATLKDRVDKTNTWTDTMSRYLNEEHARSRRRNER